MELIGPKYIGREISIRTLRDYILDKGITENDTIALNTKNFDEIVLEYRKHYNTGFTVPYRLLGVLIEEDVSREVPVDRIMVIKDYIQEETMRIIDMEDTSAERDEIFYRCGWCGNVVNYDGAELSNTERERRIRVHEKYDTRIVPVNGYCCPNGHNE